MKPRRSTAARRGAHAGGTDRRPKGPGMPDPLFILAADHRRSIERLYERAGTTPGSATAAIIRGKELIFEAVARAAAHSPHPTATGILVDEQYGGGIPARARAAGVTVAVCAERSGQDIFAFEHPDWQRHIAAVDPDFVKVLVRYHPNGDRHANHTQRVRLALLGEFLTTQRARYLLEIVIPPSADDLSRVDGDVDRIAGEVRADHLVAAIAQLHAAGVHPDIWKVEGIPHRSGCARVADACRDGHASDVGIVVLGAGAAADTVDAWLRAAAGVDGYRGFAVGRSIWAPALRRRLDGDLTDEQFVERVADNYLRFVRTYVDAAASSR